MKITIEIAKNCKLWNSHLQVNKSLMRKLVSNILNRFDNLKQVKHFELSVLLTEEQEMTTLNTQFRNQAKATNVLSFPDIKLDWRHILEFKPDLDYMYLGDVAFCYQTIKHEAIEQYKSFEDHLIHLFVHSVLHLVGFDHKEELDAKIMENIEINVLQAFAIASPYDIGDTDK